MTEVRPLRAYAEVALGRQRSPKHDSGLHMVPYLRAANVKDGLLDLSDVKSMNFDPREQERFALRPGDVLVTEGSGSLSAVGASAVWQGELLGVICFQNTLLRLRPRPSTDPRFLGWWCRYAFADGLFASVATGANIHHVSAERVRALRMVYLALPQQRAIADYLDTETARIDALITKKRRMIELAEVRRTQLLEDALTIRGCSFPESLDHDSVRGMSVPRGWRVPKLSNILRQLTNGYVGPTRDILRDEGVRYIQGLHVKRGRIDFERRPYYVEEAWHRSRPRTALRHGDVVIVQTGDIGQCAVIPDNFGDANCHALLIARCDPHVATGDYLATYLQSNFGRHSLLRLATGALHPHLEFGIRDARIVLPPLDEQHLIVRDVRAAQGRIDELTTRLNGQLELLAEHRQALITAAVTGELDVQVAA